MTDCDMDNLFGIKSTVEYTEFSVSKQNEPFHYTSHPRGLPVLTPDYREDYIEKLNDVFCYEQYEDDNNYTLKLKVDYIKHNTTVAFPTAIFVRESLNEIPYKITSRNNPEIIEGVLEVMQSMQPK